MCLIVLQPAKSHVPSAYLERAKENNPDGIGYAFVKPNHHIVVRHYIDDYYRFLEEYLDDHRRYGRTSPFLLHFRLATQGSVTRVNCHPFSVAGGVFAHNGVFSGLPGKPEPKESDTRHFARTVLSHLPRFWYRDPIWCHILEEYLGISNKLAFLWRDGSTTILNETMGVTEDNIWYSNRSYQYLCYWYGPTRTVATYPGTIYDDDNELPYRCSDDHLMSDEEIQFWLDNGEPDDVEQVADVVGEHYLESWCKRNGFTLIQHPNGGLEVKKARLVNAPIPIR